MTSFTVPLRRNARSDVLPVRRAVRAVGGLPAHRRPRSPAPLAVGFVVASAAVVAAVGFFSIRAAVRYRGSPNDGRTGTLLKNQAA
jgi:hypothetical protein